MINYIFNLDNKISELVILHKNALKFIIFFIFILILRITIENNCLVFFLSYLLIIYDNTKYLKFHKNIILSITNSKINNIFLIILSISFYYNFIYLYYIFFSYMIFLGIHLYTYFNYNYIELISIQNCFSDKQNFWTYTFLINYNNKKKIITKRFSECYKLINSLKNINIKKIHLLNNNTYNNTIKKANILNTNFNNLLNNRSILHNSLFSNFINNNNNNYNNTTIIEKHTLSNNDNLIIDNNYIKNILDKCYNFISDNIESLFILNEINYFNISKKRIFLLTKDSIIKVKYIITENKFAISDIIDLSLISYIEISTIVNTTYFKNKKIIIIHTKTKKIRIISINDSHYYNIDSLISKLNNKNIILIYNDSYTINNGLALTENIFNNDYYINLKNSMFCYYKYIYN